MIVAATVLACEQLKEQGDRVDHENPSSWKGRKLMGELQQQCHS